MRWVVRLVPLVALMAWFHRLTAAGPLDARATLALGFLLVTAWLIGKIAEPTRLPRITAFLIAGFSIGPAWLNLIRADELGALHFIGDATIALIALSVGCELPMSVLGARRSALARLAAGTMLFPFAAVALVAFSVSPWFPLSAHQALGNGVGLAFALGVIAGVGSPLAILGVTDELEDESALGRTLLGVSVIKDLAALVLLPVALALAHPIGRGGAVNVGVAWGSLARSAGSLAVGAALAVLVALYARRGRGDLSMLVIAFAAGCALAARELRLDAILIALGAGLCLATAFPAESVRVRDEVRRGSLVVYAVAFGLAGAGLRLDVLDDLWPWALLLVGLRLVTLRYGTMWAGRSPNVAPAEARDGWLGLVSQGGVVLLLARTAREAFPGWGVSLEALVLAMAAVHETVGPACLRWVLERGRVVAPGAETTKERAVVVAGLLAALILATPGRIRAQMSNDVAELTGSARSAGLAGAGVALVGDAGSVFANPAGIATIRRIAVEGSYERYMGGRQLAGAAGALRLGRLDLGVGGQALDAPSGTPSQPTDFLAMSTLVYRFGLIAAGTSLKYVREATGVGGQVDAWAGDAGVAIALFDIAAIGASVQNLGGDFGGGIHLPRTTRVGFTMNYVDPQGTARLLTTIEGRWEEGQSAMLTVGAEGGIVARGVGLVARVAATGQPAGSNFSPITLGGGVELGRFHIDYAYRAYRTAGSPRHRIGVRWTP